MSTTRTLDPTSVAESLNRCFVPMLDALGWRGSMTQLREALPYQAEAVTLSEFCNALANLKFVSQIHTLKPADSGTLVLPGVCVTPEQQAFVLVRREADRFLVFDGVANRYRELAGTYAAFSVMGLDKAVLLKPQPNWFRKLQVRFYRLYAVGFLISALLSGITFVSPLFIQSLYNQMLVADSVKNLGSFAVGVTIFILGDLGFRLIRSRLFSYIGVRMGYLVNLEILRRVLYLPPLYTESAATGSQLSRFQDFEAVSEFFGGPAIIAILEMPFIFFWLGGLVVLAGAAAYVPIAGILLFLVLGGVMYPMISNLSALNHTTTTNRQEMLMDILSAFTAIRHTSTTRFWLEKYKAVLAESILGNYRTANLNPLTANLSSALVTLTGLLTVAVGVLAVLNGSISMGALMAAMLLVWRVLAPLRNGIATLTQLSTIRRSIEQLNRLMTFNLEARSDLTHTIAKKIQGTIRFSEVSIRYAEHALPALLGVNATLPESKLTLVTGHNGAGKSTLLKLILGMYTPQTGRIMIGQTNVRQYDPLVLRRSIAYSPQRPMFFSGTLRYNLLLARPEATDARLEQVLADVGLSSFYAQLPEGLDHYFSTESLAGLSPALLKTLDLARVLLKASPIMLIDDLDQIWEPEALTRIRDLFTRLTGAHTLVIVTSADLLIPVADHCIVLEKGRIKIGGRIPWHHRMNNRTLN